MTIIREVFSVSIGAINPSLGFIDKVLGDPVSGYLTHTYGQIALTPVTAISNIGFTIGQVFMNIWNWLLYNLVTPLIIIASLILIVWLQIKLIKIYISFLRNISIGILNGIDELLEHPLIKKILSLDRKRIDREILDEEV